MIKKNPTPKLNKDILYGLKLEKEKSIKDLKQTAHDIVHG